MMEQAGLAPQRWTAWPSTMARWCLGAAFVLLGSSKALHPEVFFKLAGLYGIIGNQTVLGAIAATLPWFEVFCGLLLVAGVAVRGTAALLLGMLVVFTGAVLWRALTLAHAGGIPLCALEFDCGCGSGPEFVCPKLAGNAALAGLSGWLIFQPDGRFSLRYHLFSGKLRR